MRKELISLMLVMITITMCEAQIKLKAIASFEYSYGIPINDLHHYINNKVYDGANLEYRHFIKRDFTLGFRTGWNSFKVQLPRAVYETDKGTVSSVQTRFFSSLPFLLTSHYYLRSLHYVMPYIGGGAGAYLTKYEKWFGVVPFRENTINFGLSPEIGVIIPFKNSGVGIKLNGKFTQVFYSHNEIKNLSYFEISGGLYFGYVTWKEEHLKIK